MTQNENPPFAPFQPLPPQEPAVEKKPECKSRDRKKKPAPAKAATPVPRKSEIHYDLQTILAAAAALPPEDVELFGNWIEQFAKLEPGQRGRIWHALDKVLG